MPGQGGARRDGSARSRGSRGPATRRSGRTRGRPPSPRAGDEGQHLGLGRASPQGGSGEPRTRACTGKRCYFVCRLPGYGEAFIFPLFLQHLQLCNLLGLHVGASRMKAHLDRSRSPVFMKLVYSLGLWSDRASAAFDNEWKKEGRMDWAELGKKIRDWAGQV